VWCPTVSAAGQRSPLGVPRFVMIHQNLKRQCVRAPSGWRPGWTDAPQTIAGSEEDLEKHEYRWIQVYDRAFLRNPNTFLRVALSLSLLASILPQIWVGVLLITQPFYIGGIENVEKAKGSAFGAATAFFFTFLVSIIYVIRDGRRLAVGGGSFIGGGGSPGIEIPRQIQNPFASRVQGGSLFHDYDPVDTDTPEAFERGVFS